MPERLTEVNFYAEVFHNYTLFFKFHRFSLQSLKLSLYVL
jgi:hypothetical protein